MKLVYRLLEGWSIEAILIDKPLYQQHQVKLIQMVEHVILPDQRKCTWEFVTLFL